jgi:hypothetical protein
MNFVKAVFVALISAVSASTIMPQRSEALPLQIDTTAMKATLDEPIAEVRYGYGRWGSYRGWGYRRWGYRGGWGLGAAGAVVGGAIARSAYYGGGYPYYDGDYAYPYYDGGYAYDNCSPYTRYYSVRPYYGW